MSNWHLKRSRFSLKMEIKKPFLIDVKQLTGPDNLWRVSMTSTFFDSRLNYTDHFQSLFFNSDEHDMLQFDCGELKPTFKGFLFLYLCALLRCTPICDVFCGGVNNFI